MENESVKVSIIQSKVDPRLASDNLTQIYRVQFGSYRIQLRTAPAWTPLPFGRDRIMREMAELTSFDFVIQKIFSRATPVF